ncbi:hypothetical protein [Bilophila wadsworthia]
MESVTDFDVWLDQFPDGLTTEEKADLCRVAKQSGDTEHFSSQKTKNGIGLIIYDKFHDVEYNLCLATPKARESFLRKINESSDFDDAELDEGYEYAMRNDKA